MNTNRISTLFMAIMMLAGTSLIAGCIPQGIKGDGNVVKENRDVAGFSSLKVSSAFTVFLTQGNAESLSVEADKNLMEHIKTVVKGDRLVITTSDKGISKFTKMNIYLTFKDLEMIDVSGAVDIIGEGAMNFDELFLEGSGASEMKLELKANKLQADFSGASEIELIGSASAVDFESSGASEINAYDFVAEHCVLDVSGASDARVHVTATLNVDVSGAASVKYKGSPKVSSDVSGAASLRSY